jgi:membrane protein implicated in regulation of membrane protease activity
MEILPLLNFAAATTTIIAAILVASNYSPAVMVYGFSIFVVASVLWMLAGLLDNKTSLVVQNAVLLVVNAVGIWRWMPRARTQSSAKPISK